MTKEWRLGQSSVEEVFEMAALVEQGGYEFYERLIAGASSRRVQAELEFRVTRKRPTRPSSSSSSTCWAELHAARSGPS